MTLLGIVVFINVIKMRILRPDHPALGRTLNLLISVLIIEKERTQRETQGRPCEEGGRDWSYAAIN